MNPVMESLAKQIEQMGAIALDQAPLVYRDIIVAGYIDGILGLCVAAACLVAVVAGAKRTDLDSDELFPGLLWPVIMVFGSVAGSIALLGSLTELLTAWLAPRAYLIDYLR